MPYQKEYVELVKINPCHEGILLDLCAGSEKTKIFDARWLDVFGESEDEIPRLMYRCFSTIRTLAERVMIDSDNGGVISENSLEYAKKTYELMCETLEELDGIIADENEQT